MKEDNRESKTGLDCIEPCGESPRYHLCVLRLDHEGDHQFTCKVKFKGRISEDNQQIRIKGEAENTSLCAALWCDQPAKGCEYCEEHHMRLCGQLHHRIRQGEAEKAPCHSSVVAEKDNSLKAALAEMNAQPDVSGNDSERLRGFCRMTAVEVKAVGMVSAATSLEMIGYMRELEWQLAGQPSTSDVFNNPDRGMSSRNETESVSKSSSDISLTLTEIRKDLERGARPWYNTDIRTLLSIIDSLQAERDARERVTEYFDVERE